MSDLQNPLFDEEKEFLERKKLEYERALRGDVDHIKDQSVKVGKVAAVGAGLAGGIWLITKAFSGKKKKKHNPYIEEHEEDYGHDGAGSHGHYNGFDTHEFDHDGEEFDADDETGRGYYTAGNGKRYKSKFYRKSAADSARAFAAHDEQHNQHGQSHQNDNLDFGTATSHAENRAQLAGAGLPAYSSGHDTEEFEDDPFQDLPYDDSRRLPNTHAFDEEHGPTRPSFVTEVLQSFLKSDTGKVIVGQVAAVALALVTKKVSEFFPADKNSDAASDNSGVNSDLATSSGYAPVETGFAPVASSVSPDSPDASTHYQSL
ncbi:hypothetical protein [Hymenobacter properus]|uniref:Uncharacterized protein n=1 Tax=Hymenobacter properus TaxID=2791026 RepID=A0A931BI14_9BACT|nr:hypothetical protein [Hymenobacter properus]MBF9142866.1 hypothetical protein [Hymenobacter properus]MBR7721673.1 hypothetical protein [Microvirga sp. SRT04]